MENLPLEEAAKIAYRYVTFADAKYARKLYLDFFYQKLMSEMFEHNEASLYAAAAVYQAGRIDGIRKERKRRHTEKRRPKEE